MRRASSIFALCLVLLAGGVCALLMLPGTELLLPGVSGLRANRLAGMGCFFGAGMVGLLGLLSMRGACRKLAANAIAAASTAYVQPPEGSHCGNGTPRLATPHPDLDVLVDSVNRILDAAGRAVAEAELRCKELEIQLKVATAERQHAEAIIYSISDGVLVTDPFDEVVLANDSAARTFSFDLNMASRSRIDGVLGDARMVNLIREMRQSDSRGGRRIVEHKVQTPAGERVYKVTLSCVPGKVSAGNSPSGVVAVLHDMTREKEVAELKNDFVSSVSHELRTPLASIKAYAEMLIDGEAADDRTRGEFYEVIQNEANRLGRLIDNILNISRIESGLVKINRRPVSLMVLLKEATEVISPQARQKRVQVVEEIAPAFCQVMGDRDMLYESMLNLLSNAVKYTPEEGRITVQTVVDESQKKAAVRICDTGVGIPQKDLPFVFDKFYRCEGNARMAKGTGLGLSLVKHIIETVHHGRLFVESEVGKGSAFGFELELIE